MTDKIFARKIAGSALILVVVLTSLLAIVGVMFVMVARVDRIATSAISENKTLDYAVEAVIARISQELVLDVPGVVGQEYYDYPDAKNAWLASLEPHKDGTDYKWRQISDVTGYIGPAARRNVDVDIIEDHKEIELDSNGDIESSPEQLADADGDGVADSKWIELDDITSSKGKTIYAAIRVIDNGAMLNVNTARQFNPNSAVKNEIDGSSQTQIDLFALSERGASNFITDLDNMRRGSEIWDLDDYIRDVVWRYYVPDGEYTPFDISDELELRNRFSLNREDIDSRIEVVWTSAFRGPDYLSVPVGSSSSSTLNSWEDEVYYEASDVNDVNTYSYRHIGTTYNMDRIINPVGVVLNNGKMVNVNRDGAGLIYSAIGVALFTADPNFKDIDEIAAQTAVNLVDFCDGASEPNVTTLDVNGITYYGFERPCIYISELAHRFVKPNIDMSPLPDSLVRMSWGIELYKPYVEDDYPDANQWQLRIEGYKNETFPVDWSGNQAFHVMLFEHQDAPLDVNSDSSLDRKELTQSGVKVFKGGKIISLQRLVGTDWITVDSETVPYSWEVSGGGWLDPLSADNIARSIQRDITLHKCIRRLWDQTIRGPTLGGDNSYTDPSDELIQAHPANRDFTNVGEIGMVFRKGAYYINPADRPDTIGYSTNTDDEAEVRVNLADPNYHNIFKYLTVWLPSGYALDPNEVRIKGRININTAPWYVIAQLPWMTDKIAQAIVAYRDKLDSPIDYSDPNTGREDATDIDGIRETAGFASIGELATVINNDSGANDYSMRYYALGAESGDLLDYPDLSYADEAPDDFEERDVIFARLSNLVTVRSDVFTAYMLVRIGADGPQKRVMAILDRSNVYSDDGRVQIVALHAVPDPR